MHLQKLHKYDTQKYMTKLHALFSCSWLKYLECYMQYIKDKKDQESGDNNFLDQLIR